MNIIKESLVKRKAFALSLACYVVFGTAAHAQQIGDDIQITWQMDNSQLLAKKSVSKLILKNNGSSPVVLNDWSLWFNYIRGIDSRSIDPRFTFSHRNGDLYEINFKKENFILNPKDTVQIYYTATGNLMNYTDAPIGLYFQELKNKKAFQVRQYHVKKDVAYDRAFKETFFERKYQRNSIASGTVAQPVIPLPAKITQATNGLYTLQKAQLFVDNSFQKEEKFLTDFFTSYTSVKPSKASLSTANIKILKKAGLPKEGYELSVNAKGIVIHATDAAGAFYGIQSLQSLIPAEYVKEKSKAIKIPFTEIKDHPRYAYRGFMLDAARNFFSKEEVFRLLDAMAMFKLNKFHFHLIDDEGWRLEIPGLPELTEVGARRDAQFHQGKTLQPSYGSGAFASEKQYYTVADYTEILKYAKARHIEVVPEIETPGHARAALKAMRARYATYMAQGNKQKAEEFLLDDAADKSLYISAQNWNDNVMNPALPSTYHFLNTVVAAVKKMHIDAGSPLTYIDLGGDETPRDVWTKSPEILAFMKANHINNTLDIWPYYINRINEIVQKNGLKLSGWEEMGMSNKGSGMDVNPELAHHDILLNVWNNLPGGGEEDLAYRLANAGYKVVYTSANNNYLDITWDRHFQEPGHNWVGTTDLLRTYSFSPSNFFVNFRTTGEGKELPQTAYTNKVQLNETGKKNLIGVKGALWSEKIQTNSRLEAMIFPKLIAIADRGWAPEQKWESSTTFDEADFNTKYQSFLLKLSKDVLPKMDFYDGGFEYRMPTIGIKVENNHLLVNADYPTYAVFYAVQGSENFQLVKGPIPYDSSKTYIFYTENEKGRKSESIQY